MHPSFKQLIKLDLPWQLSVMLLSLACYPVALVCQACGKATVDRHEVMALTATLILLLGFDPFFLRRSHCFNLAGIVLIAGLGLAIGLVGWLFGTNLLVLVWFGMTWMLARVAQITAWGRMTQPQIELEESIDSNPPTRQKEVLLMAGDFAIVAVIYLLLLLAGSALL
jgi:hypothetical protein